MQTTFDLSNINSVRPRVRDILKYKSSGSALDLGTSVGRHALFLAKNGFSVTAVDNRTEVLAALRELARLQKLRIKVEQVDVTQFIFQKKFDVILCNMLLHFLPHKAQAEIITKMQAVTKKGGLNLVSVYTSKNPKDPIRPYLPKPGTLKQWYVENDWKVLFYYEGLVETTPRGKKTLRVWQEEILAEKIHA